MTEKEVRDIRNAVRAAYDPIHPIKIKATCMKCEWSDEFVVHPTRTVKRK